MAHSHILRKAAEAAPPIFFFDIDGVLLDLSSPFSTYTNRHRRNADEPDWMQVWEGFLQSTDASALPSLVNPAAFNAFSEQYEVRLITGFPVSHRVKRLDNLALHGFRYRELYFVDTPEKAKFIQHASGGRLVVYMEDDPLPLMQLKELLPEALLLQFCPVGSIYDHNSALPRIASWEAFWEWSDSILPDSRLRYLQNVLCLP